MRPLRRMQKLEVGHYASEVGHCASEVGHSASEVGHSASEVGDYASSGGYERGGGTCASCGGGIILQVVHTYIIAETIFINLDKSVKK